MGHHHGSAFTAQKIFTTESDFRKHLSELQTLAMRKQTDIKDDRTFSSAFNNIYKIFKIEAEIMTICWNFWSRKLQFEKKSSEHRYDSVFTQSLAKETFFEVIDKLLSTLFSFTAHGSRWIMDKTKTLELKMADFAPVRESSYLALPSELLRVRSLLNIRNHLDNKCFLYCFTAAHQLFRGPPFQTDTS